MGLNKADFLKPRDVPQEIVQVPELGGHITVRGLTARGRSQFESRLQSESGKISKQKQTEIRERLLVACCIDDNGDLLFTDQDISAIGNLPASVIEPIVNVAQRLSGLSTDTEALAKNSDETTGD